ncbi:MAG: hypothetical protein K2N58_01980 [Treponemataceae bacterium]|nr:hypothetical protein [Treponemataceae bacterium]
MKKLKKLIAIFVALLATGMTAFAQETVQVVMPESVNLSGSEKMWLPGQIQDTLKSNLQEYLSMRTVVDSASESMVKKLQRESESNARDENTAIEVGKISTANFAVFTTIRRMGNGYTISVDYTDLTTGVQKATVTSKEYKNTEELYGNTGAIDEITLTLADRLQIAINPIQRRALQYGTADFSIDDQLTLAKQNEVQYKKRMKELDEQLSMLSVSTDLNAVENSKKIEAEKALLAQKQESEQKRLIALAEQKKRAAEDALKEAERTDDLKKERVILSAQAAAKAAEVRKLKMERQGVFGQINVIESKKKALVEIRQGIETRIEELRKQAEQDKTDEANRINGTWLSVELENGSPTEAAQRRHKNQIAEYNKQRDASFKEEAERVRTSATKQEEELLSEIRNDQQKIMGFRTVSSMGDELKVSYGAYNGKDNGWNAYLSLYSDGILMYQDTVFVAYKALTGKNAPNIEKSSDAEVQNYADTVDMYNSLLLRGDPILYFEIDYSVTAAPDYFPGKYTFDFQVPRVINTVTDIQLRTNARQKTLERTMSPVWDIRPFNEQDAQSTKLQMAQDLGSGKYFDINYKTRKTEKDPWVMTYSWKKDNKGHVVAIDDLPAVIHDTRNEFKTLRAVLTGHITKDLLKAISQECKDTKTVLYLDFSNVTGFGSVFLDADFKLNNVEEILFPKSIRASIDFFNQFKYIGFCGTKKEWYKAVGSRKLVLGNYTTRRISGNAEAYEYTYSFIPMILYEIEPTSDNKYIEYANSNWQIELNAKKKKGVKREGVRSYDPPEEMWKNFWLWL